MSEKDIADILLAFGVLIGLAHVVGYMFDRLKQPRLIGEIAAGVLLGPYVLAKLAPSIFETFFNIGTQQSNVASIVFYFLYWLGLIMLMFISGSHVRGLLSNENRKATAYILLFGKPLAFIVVLLLGLTSVLPLYMLVGENGSETPILLVLCCAVAVTSIPVLSRIFQDLNILNTRFAGLVLGIAVLEDIVLWAVLAVATSYATTAQSSYSTIYLHIGGSIVYLLLGLLLFPKILSSLRKWKGNLLLQISPIAYVMVVLSSYIVLAGAMKVNIVFAAFLAGYGIVGGAKGLERSHFKETLSVIHKFSFATLVPIYFGIVGYRLVFNSEFSLGMLLVFLVGSSAIAISAVGLASLIAGFNKKDIANLAITLNARGGPGIVLASIAYDAQIINAAFYTTLVLTALVTSALAGNWLRYVMRRGWPLLSESKA